LNAKRRGHQLGRMKIESRIRKLPKMRQRDRLQIGDSPRRSRPGLNEIRKLGMDIPIGLADPGFTFSKILNEKGNAVWPHILEYGLSHLPGFLRSKMALLAIKPLFDRLPLIHGKIAAVIDEKHPPKSDDKEQADRGQNRPASDSGYQRANE
jgi:hypothetical protein